MDNSTINLLLDLPAVEVEKVELLKNKIIICCHSILEEQLCPCCLKKVGKVKSVTERSVKDLKMFGKEVELKLTNRQFFCEDCDKYFHETFPFVSKGQHMTHRLEKYLYECCKEEAVDKVAVRENIEWNILQKNFIKYSKEIVDNIAEKTYKQIGIDEFAHKKGKKDYATVVVDLQRGMVIDVLDFRTKEELMSYFKAKGEVFCEKVEVFSCDMWPGFANTAKEVFPNADVVVDRFHFFGHLNKAVDQERKKLKILFKEYDIFKLVKWALFKRWEYLTPEERRLLLRCFKVAPILRELYFLKNELVNIFESNLDSEKAEKLCEEWLEKARKMNHLFLNNFIKTFENWKQEVYNFFKHHVTNGVVEGINNLIKTIKRQSFGFTNFNNFRLKIIVQFY
jgi:transposase